MDPKLLRIHTTLGGGLTGINPGKEAGAQVRVVVDLPGDEVQAHGIEGGGLAGGSGGCAMYTAVELVLGSIGHQELVVPPAQESLRAVVDEGVVRVGHAARYPLDGQLPGDLEHLGGRHMGAGIAGRSGRHRGAQLGRQQFHQRGAVRLIAKHKDTGGD